MLNLLWAFMILIGIIFAAFTGNLSEVTNAALDSSKEAVSLCITMMGVMSFWVGLMEIAAEAGHVHIYVHAGRFEIQRDGKIVQESFSVADEASLHGLSVVDGEYNILFRHIHSPFFIKMDSDRKIRYGKEFWL